MSRSRETIPVSDEVVLGHTLLYEMPDRDAGS